MGPVPWHPTWEQGSASSMALPWLAPGLRRLHWAAGSLLPGHPEGLEPAWREPQHRGLWPTCTKIAFGNPLCHHTLLQAQHQLFLLVQGETLIGTNLSLALSSTANVSACNPCSALPARAPKHWNLPEHLELAPTCRELQGENLPPTTQGH